MQQLNFGNGNEAMGLNGPQQPTNFLRDDPNAMNIAGLSE
jgi:hypothetical protein